MTTRKQILEMLSAGEIDVTRATELLNEARAGNAVPVEDEPPLPPVPPPAPEKPIAPAKQGGPRWLHIHVSESGKRQTAGCVSMCRWDWFILVSRIGRAFYR